MITIGFQWLRFSASFVHAFNIEKLRSIVNDTISQMFGFGLGEVSSLMQESQVRMEDSDFF